MDTSRRTLAEVLAENELLRQEIRTAREAAEITAALVVEQFEQSQALLMRVQQANDEIREKSDLLNTTLESISQGISVTDKDLNLLLCNRRMLDMFGYPEELGRRGTPLGAYHAYRAARGDFDEAEASERLAALRNRMLKTEAFVRQADTGNGRVIDIAYEPIRDGWVVTFTDVSEHKRIQGEIEKARAIADAANAAKSDFLANMSHEIRTPMNAIIGMTHLALQTELDARQRNFLEKVDAAAKSLLGIINDILDFSKIEAGKIAFERIAFDLDDVLDSLSDLAVIKAQDKGLELLFDVGVDVPTSLVGDPLRLGQVLTNLVSNAIKFTERGEVTVAIRRVAEPGDAPESVRLSFAVQDTGIGLTEEQRSRLFSAFSQADSSTTRKYGGTGLGLSICKRLVELMDGEIGVDSEPGRGSTFAFTGRFGILEEMPALQAVAEHVPGLRILVVDDNASARDIFLAMLASLRFEARAVGDAEAALAELARAEREGHPYGLVLMDWQMPRIDGIEAVRRIQTDKRLVATPTCMMVTAYSRDELQGQLAREQVRVDGLLVKPVSPSTLCDSIMTVFGKDIGRRLRQERRETGQREAQASLAGSRILLVEDNDMNRELALEILGGAGIEVAVAGDGAQALEQLVQNEFDAVLMDCQMPVMDGFEATRRLRAEGRTLPVIAMTANAMAGDRERCLAAGMNDHVAKPIDVGQLFAVLARWIEPKAPAAVAASKPVRALPETAGLNAARATVRPGSGAANRDRPAAEPAAGRIESKDTPAVAAVPGHGAARASDNKANGDLPIARRLNAILIAAIAAVLGVAGIILSQWLGQNLEARNLADLQRTNRQVVDMIDAYSSVLERSAEMLGAQFAASLPPRLSLDGATRLQTAGARFPALRGGGTTLNNNTEVVDGFTASTGATATVFVRQGDDFFRVTTSVKKEDGTRAIGTSLGSKHPGYARLIAGEAYTGRAMLFGRDYMTRYIPLKDAAGRIIGVAYIGIDFTEGMAALKKKVLALKVGETGRVFALDAVKEPGKAMIHAVAEDKNLIDAKDGGGRFYVREMLDLKQGVIRYDAVNRERGETSVRRAVTAIDSFEKWGWLVGTESYADEFTREVRGFQAQFTIAAILLAIVLVLALYFNFKAAAKEIEKSRRLAEEANAAKSGFLANMSHEIRTPMNAIIGMTHLALQTGLDARQRNYLEKVDGAAKNLLGIINDILDFSKIEAGKINFERIDFNLDDVMDGVADLTALKAQDKGLELLFDIGTDVPVALVGDPLRLGQVLTNLVGNAIKFTERGEVTVVIKRVAADAEGIWLRFAVADTGVGLTEEQRSRLFSAFSQADSSTTRKYGGTGLGLTICRRLVQMMDGEIGVDSEPGVGSVFHFTARLGLPRSDASPQALDAVAGHVPGLRILVVDDNASARDIFLAMLASLRFEANAVGDAEAALAELERAQGEGRPYGLVLMDWQMPRIDGIEAVRRIQADKRLVATPTCMMVTAYSRDEMQGQLAREQLRVDGLLVKPVSPSTLCDSIMTVFGKDIGRRLRQERRETGSREAQASLAGSRILLVEDNDMNRELALEILGGAGIEVAVAGDGAQALEQLAQNEFDAVLMDCQMPVMDGFEATRRLRAERRTLPVIAMTANAMAGDRERCLAAGMNDHVAKPIDVGQLFAVLARWVKPKARAEVPAPAIVAVPTPAAVAASAPAHALPEAPGLDAAGAIARLGGNTDLYVRMLGWFRDEQTGAIAAIRAAWHAQDREGAVRAAHTLKGLAGNLGAQPLAAAAAQVEKALAAAPAELPEDLLAALAEPLAVLLAAIDAVAPASDTAADASDAAEPFDAEKLAPAMKDFAALLADNDMEAAMQVEAVAALLSGDAAADFRAVTRLAQRYALDEALEALRAFAAKWDVALE